MAESPNPIAEIDHGPSKLDQFLDQHTSKLVIGAILIALGVIGYVIYSGLARADQEEAGAALNAAETSSEYQNVISKWPKTKSAESAMLLLAGVQWEDSQSEAIQTLRDFLAEHPEHPAAATAKVSLALRLVEQGKSADATSLLTEVANDENSAYIAPLALITLGDIAKAAGHTDEATTWYEKAAEDTTGQGNTYASTAKARLSLVNAVPPTKVKPAPPAPTLPPATPSPPSLPTTPAATPAPALPPLVAPDGPDKNGPPPAGNQAEEDKKKEKAKSAPAPQGGPTL